MPIDLIEFPADDLNTASSVAIFAHRFVFNASRSAFASHGIATSYPRGMDTSRRLR